MLMALFFDANLNGTKDPILVHKLRIKVVSGAKLGSRSSTGPEWWIYTALKIETKIGADPPIAVKVHDATHHSHKKNRMSSKEQQKLNAAHERIYRPHAHYYEDSGKSKCSAQWAQRDISVFSVVLKAEAWTVLDRSKGGIVGSYTYCPCWPFNLIVFLSF